MDKHIGRLALPNVIANISVPLLGMVDTAIVGHLSSMHIAAIAIGTSIFNLIYWNFGFLRMGTSGFTAQAFGAKRFDVAIKTLIQASFIALCAATLLISLQHPIARGATLLFATDATILHLALTYFAVRIWAAPATLGLYAIKGWFIGLQKPHIPMWISIALNVVNIVCSLAFVLVWHWDIAGVALGTVIAQYSGLAIGIVLTVKEIKQQQKRNTEKQPLIDIIADSIQFKAMGKFFKVNADIFLRTVCLSAVFTFLPVAGAHIGGNTLAINTLLMQLFTLFSYIMDGLAYAGESLVGRYIGARHANNLRLALRRLTLWSAIFAILFSALYASCGQWILGLFTNDNALLTYAKSYVWWVVAVPICGFGAFLMDGVYIGATASSTMLHAMLAASLVFVCSYFGLKLIFHPDTYTPTIWNGILWTSFLLFLATRSIVQWARLRRDIIDKIS
ncbi:MAG: MATE family efflux transporter [Bacteroidales bacterium]|nr:MATE family efflux transporter [Bacteroidales bacterium]MBR1850694.1 MATE family efflux transporter [Bacteroidales bacterium]